jgi:WD40 repeat protein/subtilisin-like proprotein convertase family protein
MPKLERDTDFFVVRGPVLPGQACYVGRPADTALLAATRARRLTCVIAPPGSGKTSLAAQAAATLQRRGELVVEIDLGHVALAPGAAGDAWPRALAEVVARALKIEIDLETWWMTPRKKGRGLVDFFWEIVLANSTVPVTVFLDDVDVLAGTPAARGLLAALRACYARRETESDFRRLNFVLLGDTPAPLIFGVEQEPLIEAAATIELADFSREEAHGLAIGFGGAPELARALMDRVYSWTDGQPYLTQKIACEVARRGGRLEDVERVARDLCTRVTRTRAHEDSLLERSRRIAVGSSPVARRAAKTLRRLGAGRAPAAPRDPAVAGLLFRSGLVRFTERGVEPRSRLQKELVARWLPERHVVRNVVVAVLVLGVVAGAFGYWYTQRLPSADLATLTQERVSVDAADAAYRRLHDLPGFAERADALFVAALRREGAVASTVEEAAAVDERLRRFEGQASEADRLLAEFWLRRANQAMQAERRDAALLLAQRAAEFSPVLAAPLSAELRDGDYRLLERTFPAPAPPAGWRMDFARDTMLWLDEEKGLVRAAVDVADSVAAVRPTVLVHEALRRELMVTGDGTAGDFTLTVELNHAVSDEILLSLTAPSGMRADVNVPRGAPGAAESFTFAATAGAALGMLADEGREGLWRLELVDRSSGNTGELIRWGLEFAGEEFADAPDEPVVIPDPSRTEAADVSVVGDLAIARPKAGGALGTFALWSAAAGVLVDDFTLPEPLVAAAVGPRGRRALGAGERLVMLWSVTDKAVVSRLSTDTRFVLPPVFSSDGGYFAIAEDAGGERPLCTVLRSADASLVGTFECAASATAWWLGPGARYAVFRTAPDVLVVLDAARGSELRRVVLERPLERLLTSPEGARLITVDAAGAIEAWALAPAAQPPVELGTAASIDSVAFSTDALRLAFTAANGDVVVRDVTGKTEIARLRGTTSASPRIAPDGTRLVTAADGALRFWTLPAEGATPSAEGAADVTAAAIGANGVVAGRRSGQLGIASFEPGVLDREDLEFFGHRGPVSAVAVQGDVAASGGLDGVVRVWSVASGAPTTTIMQPIDAPIGALALSGDGRLVAAEAGGTVRVGDTANGKLVVEIPTPGLTALAFAPNGESLALGTVDGTLTLASLSATPDDALSIRGDAAVTAVAFARAGDIVAAGDAAGGIRLLRTRDGSRVASVRYAAPLRWLALSDDGTKLLAATDHWLHLLAAGERSLQPMASRLLPVPSNAFASSGDQVRVAGLDSAGHLSVSILDTNAPAPADVTATERDWSAVLGLRIAPSGAVEPLEP